MVISIPLILSVLELGLPLNISNEDGKKERVRIFFLTGFIKNKLTNINATII